MLGDPLLHTHTLVANRVKGADDLWSALDAKRIYHHSHTAGYLYQVELRHQLTCRLGVAWTEVHKGHAEIEGVPKTLIRAMSQRRGQIEERMTERGESGPKAAQAAAYSTRKAKDYSVTSEVLLLPVWTRPPAWGLARRSLKSSSTESRQRTSRRRTSSAAELTKEQASFGRQEVVRAVCEQLRAGISVERAEDLADRFLASERVVPLLAAEGRVTQSGVIRRGDAGSSHES